jgi:hypothetical protein
MNEDAQTYTSIQLTLSLRDRLKDLGKKGESYEDIIESCLKHTTNKNKRENNLLYFVISTSIVALIAERIHSSIDRLLIPRQ